jgi:hypothetical protein
MMLWTVYHTVIIIKDDLIYAEELEPDDESIGVFVGGNCEEVIEKTCKKIGHPIRFDKDAYEPGSHEYIFKIRDPSTLVMIHHQIKVAPIGDLLKLNR